MLTTVENHTLDLEKKTVFYIDHHGEYWDLNARGEEIKNLYELEKFVLSLYRQGAFNRGTFKVFVGEIDYARK